MRLLSMTVLALAAAGAVAGEIDPLAPSGRFSVPEARVARTPTMGWNPWNAFRTEVTEEKIMAVAEALQRTGLADAGYRYVNMDDGWWLQRAADGRIEVRTSMFPSAAVPGARSSLRPFVDRLHAMGFKAGIYTDIGRNACSQAWDARSPNLPAGTQLEREVGSYGHQAGDMRLLLGEWGFDLVKVDACGLADYSAGKAYVRSGQYRALGPLISRADPAQSDNAEVESLYASLRREIDGVRPRGDVILSLCTWGEGRVADWGKQYGQQWRTSPDIRPTWASMLRNFDSAAARPLYAGPGRWNDPDMLELGHGDFDAAHLTEARAHVSLWAVISAPLILGADLTRLAPELVEIARNRDVIAINQDVAGHQGVFVARDRDTAVIAKTLAARGAKAVALVNRSAEPRTVSVALSQLNLQDGASMTDVWTRQAQPVAGGRISMQLAAHETALLLVHGRTAFDGVYLSEIPARINVAAAPRDRALPLVPAQVNATPSGEPLALDGERVRQGLGVLAGSRLEVRLDREFQRFQAYVGAQGGASASYRVYGDGKLLFERSSAATETLDLPVQGVRTLELVAASPGAAGHAVTVIWGEARLMR